MAKQRIRLTESQLNRVIKESVKRLLRETEEEKPSYDEWLNFLGGKTPLFEFNDGIIYVDYDEQAGCLCSGGVTNTGFHKDGEVEIPVEYGNFQRTLEAVYEELCCNHEQLEY